MSALTSGLTQNLSQVTQTVNSFFLLIITILIFSMQLGFMLLEAGGVRKKNVNNILTKASASGGRLNNKSRTFWTGCAGGFIGTTNFALSDSNVDYVAWIYRLAFAASSATIVSGAVAERIAYGSYLGYSALTTSFLYPVVVHWAWSTSGWLGSIGFIDFAGSGVVHVTGGAAALAGCYFVGPRMGRFHPDGSPNPKVRGHSSLLTALGGMLLWIGFIAFSGGSQTELLTTDPSTGAIKSIVNKVAKIFGATIMSGCGGGLSLLIYTRIVAKKWSVNKMINGSLASLVAVCASVDAIEFYNALVLGIVAGVVYELFSVGLLKLHIDDPIDSIPVHLGGGMWGTFAAGLFRTDSSLFYTGNIRLVGIQLLGIVAIVLWSGIIMGLFFGCLRYLKVLRVNLEEEKEGMDISIGDGAAFTKSWGKIV
ncbi:MAG: hypothetical protein SGCHY_003364 [Lobulomycetales sp.]